LYMINCSWANTVTRLCQYWARWYNVVFCSVQLLTYSLFAVCCL
jgi:hypothetical protein